MVNKKGSKAAVLSLPNAVTFNTAPHVVAIPNYKIIFLLLCNCCFAVMNHNKYLICRVSDI